MNKTLLSFALSFLSLVVFSQESETRDIKDFNSIQVIGKIRCEIYPSNSEKVEIISKGSELSNVLTEKEGRVLNIRLKTNTPADADIKVKVYHKTIESLFSQAQALIINKDTLVSENVNFVAKVGGKMELNIKLESLSAEVKQGGILVFSGEVLRQDISVSTSGTYSAYRLSAEESYVKALSGGKAKIIANQVLEAVANAKGYVGYKGNPNKINITTKLGGEVNNANDEN